MRALRRFIDVSDPLQVAVEQLPTSWTSFGLAAVTGILVPLMVLWVSRKFAADAERRAREHADRIRQQDLIYAQFRRAIEILDELYRSFQRLRANNLRRRSMQEFVEKTLEHNDLIMKSDSELAKQMQQDALWKTLEKQMEMDSSHSELIIEMSAILTRLQHSVGEEAAQGVADFLKEVREAAQEPGGITQDLAQRFTQELNAIGHIIEKDPDSFFISTRASSRRAYAHG